MGWISFKMKKELFIGVLLSSIAIGGFALESDGIYSYKDGSFELHMLVERENPGNAGILAGADDVIIKRYIPASGFTHSTNVFLIKTQGKIILVDTGFGASIFDKMRSLGVEPDQVDAVLITHLHGDHIGGLQKNGQAVFPKAKIYLSSKEYDHFTKVQVSQGAVAALTPYGNRVETFEPAALGARLREILPGIYPIANYGHTPGHTVYLVENRRFKIIIAGDFLHIALVQFPHPEISASYDMDKQAAADSRRQLLDYVAKNKILLGGMHMVYPAVGTVEADGRGFRFIPKP